MARFDWQLNFLSVHACRVREKGQGLEARGLLSCEGLEETNDGLERLIDGLLLAAFKKKPDTNTASACRVFSFLPTGTGEADRRLLVTALEAERLEAFEDVAMDMAARYADLPEAHPALVLFIRAKITTPNDLVLPFFVMFACDFDEVSVLSSERDCLLEKVGEAVTHRLRKAMIFPFLDSNLQDLGRLVLIQASSSEGFDEMVALEIPKTTPELFTEELKLALDRKVDAPAIEKYFREPPPKTRPLFGEERYIRLEHLLPTDQVKHVNDITFNTSKEKFDKEMKLRIAIDDFGRFEGRLDRLNRDFFFARRGDEKFLIVRADDFVTRDQLSPVEFLDVEDLDKVLSRLLE